MSTYSIKDITKTTERHKIYTLVCSPEKLPESVTYLQAENITAINIGKELASYIDALEDYSYLSIDVYDFTKKLLDKSKSKIDGTGNDVVAIYNFGILFEPRLELNLARLLKEYAKSTVIIIIWENQMEFPDRLNWPTQKNIFLDFSDTQLKKLQYAL